MIQYFFFKHHLDVRIGTFIQCPSFTCTCRMDFHTIILRWFHITLRTFRYSDFIKTLCIIFSSFFRKTEVKTSKYIQFLERTIDLFVCCFTPIQIFLFIFRLYFNYQTSDLRAQCVKALTVFTVQASPDKEDLRLYLIYQNV